ncbi:MAG: efflux RND transporter periplasmic adaptor subunit [Nibricoccus sp.]
MKTKFTLHFITVPLVALALLAGCKKQDGHDDHAGHDHSGHGHAKSTQAAQPAPVALTGAKCAAHGAPKELCFICDASLREADRLWCQEHARYEDRCWECHPELQDKKRAWCQEHSLYEDECMLCHPELARKNKPTAQTGPVLMCSEHGVPEAQCAICQPQLAAALKPGESVQVRLPSANSAGMIGVQTAAPETGLAADGIECVAEVSFNQNKFAQIAVPVSGLVHSVDVDLGDKVAEQQSVAKIWSATITETVAKAVLTHQTLERERKLRADRVTSAQALQEAEAAHRAACQQARTFGFSEEQIDALGNQQNEPIYVEVRAPFAGEIVERNAVRGAQVEAGRPLFTLADRSMMWAMLQVPEGALSHVEANQVVELRVDSLPGKVFTGKLTWVSPAVDEHSRLGRARAEFENPDGLLRDRMFATARILSRKNEKALLVPAASVQHVDGKPFVFLKREADLYEVRAVELGARLAGYQELLGGVESHEQVVVTHAYALKSAMLMSKLGAGCAHD